MTHKVNQDRKFGSAICYVHIRYKGLDHLFTEDQMAVAYERAKKNPEDLPKRYPWWQFWRYV